MLAQGRDDALLRYGLGSEYLKRAEFERAAEHLRIALAHAPDYSAAWKLLGQALAGAGDKAGAADAYSAGIKAAEGKGDLQAAREMKVFLRRLAGSAQS